MQGIAKDEALALLRPERRDMTDETAARCIYVGMSADIAGPLLTTPGADFDDDRELAVRAGYVVGSKRTTSS